MHRIWNIARFATAFGAIALATQAHAGIFRAYLSVAGSDANPCTLPQPCRLLPAALAAVNDGGEIWMLDSANFNASTVAINKSVTILAVPGALGSVVANGGDAIAINGANVRVTLRNLVMLNLSGLNNNGILMTDGAALTVEGSEIYGLQGGIFVLATGAKVVVKESTVRDCTSGIVMAAPASGFLRNVQIVNSLNGLSSGSGATVLMKGGGIVGGGTGAQVVSNVAGVASQLILDGVTISGAGVGVNAIAGTQTSVAEVVLQNATITDASNGALFTSPAVIYTRGNNTFRNNTLDVNGGVPTPLPAQ